MGFYGGAIPIGLLYVVTVLLANMFGMTFIGPVSVGTLIFGAVFTLRDRLHALGRPVVYRCIGIAVVGSGIIAMLGGAEWRVVVASVVALALNEAADTEIFEALSARPWAARVAASNAVSIPLDTILFNVIAFLGVLPLSFLAALSVVDIGLKAATSALVALWRVPRSSIAPEKIDATRP